jgi:hypothetical protein
MATAHSPEESAKAIVSCFTVQGVGAGESFVLGAVWQQLQSGGHRAREFAAGLKYAVDQGWIEHELQDETLTLTDAGERQDRAERH